MSRSVAVALGLVAACGALVACGEPRYRYLSNNDEEVYLRVPRTWSEVGFKDDIPDPLEQQTSEARVLWRSAATLGEGVSTADELTTDVPFAIATVYEVDGELNQRMSSSLARIAGAGVGFDPILPGDTSEGLSEVLEFEPLSSSGTQGSRAVFRVRSDATAEWEMVIDMTTHFDPSNFRLYVLQVACSPACYQENQNAMTSIANSWSVKP
jgi:hypothetical protein